MDSIKEKNSAKFSAVLYDESDAAIAKAAINTFTVTLYDKDTGTVINSRSAVDLYNSGAWTGSSGMVATVADTTGACTITLTSTDNQILDTTKSAETHVLFLQLTTNATNPVTMKLEIEFSVENLMKVS